MQREFIVVKIKMICFSQFEWERESEKERERGFFHIRIRLFSRDPFMVLRVICVLRAFLLLWDLYTFFPSLFHFFTPPPFFSPFSFASVACPNCLKSVVYYPNKGFCKWIPRRTGGCSVVREGKALDCIAMSFTFTKSLGNLSGGHFGNKHFSPIQTAALWVWECFFSATLRSSSKF